MRSAIFLWLCLGVMFPAMAVSRELDVTSSGEMQLVDDIPAVLYGLSGTVYRRYGSDRVWIGSNGTAIAPLDAEGRFFTDGKGKIFSRTETYVSDN